MLPQDSHSVWCDAVDSFVVSQIKFFNEDIDHVIHVTFSLSQSRKKYGHYIQAIK
jgi:hypothetical protein